MNIHDEFIEATGDVPPKAPRRLFLSRKRNIYTSKAKKWIEDERAWGIRCATWHLQKLQSIAQDKR